jgi:hypothetical protein
VGDMKLNNSHWNKLILSMVIIILATTNAWSENTINSDSDYSIKIAVTINSDDNIMGKLEYSNHAPQYPIQLVTFNPVGGTIYSEPYLFELMEMKIESECVHIIKCRSINDKYGSPEITGKIDFSDELKPKIHLVNANGNTYITNLTENGKLAHKKYIPNIWLGH